VIVHRHVSPSHPDRRRLARPALGLAVLLGAGLAATPTVGSAAPAPLAPLNSCVKKDNGDPTLQGFTFSPGSVNVTTGSKNVTFTVSATDTGGPGAASGISYGFVSLSSPDFQRSAYTGLKKNAAGKWVGTVAIPRWTHGGTWKVNTLSLGDKDNNYAYWSTSDLAGLGFPTALPVTATPDDTAPKLTAFTVSPRSVDTRSRTRNVTLTAKATDGQSGIRSIFVSAGEPGTSHRSYASLTKVSGTASTYRGTMVIQRWQTNGTWHVDSVQLYDKVGNYANKGYDQLAGFRRTFGVVSGTDTSKPTATSFARTPASVDVRTSNKSVTVTVHAKDTGSGVGYAYATFSNPAGSTAYVSMRRVSGSATNGVWKGTGTIQRCYSFPGTYGAQLTMGDLAGNQRVYNAAALAAKSWPAKLTVQAGDHVTPTVDGPSSVGPTENIVLTFNEAVNGINADSATLRQSDYPDNGPILPGTWTCATGSGADTSCATGDVRKATFDPTADLSEFESYVVELNPEHQLAVTDLAGNPFDRYQVYVSVSTP
jgi:hypothetical protein